MCDRFRGKIVTIGEQIIDIRQWRRCIATCFRKQWTLASKLLKQRLLMVFVHCDDNVGLVHDILIDCPPSLGLLTLNGLVAADRVLIPMLARYFSLEGLGALHNTIQAVREALNPRLEIEGIVFCMYDRRTNLAQSVVAEVAEHFPQYAFATRIPQNIRLSESPSHGKPALLYDIESKGAQAYLELAHELINRIDERVANQ